MKSLLLSTRRLRVFSRHDAVLTAGAVDGTRRKYTRSATPRRPHRLTPEGRRRLSQMMKKRWQSEGKRLSRNKPTRAPGELAHGALVHSLSVRADQLTFHTFYLAVVLGRHRVPRNLDFKTSCRVFEYASPSNVGRARWFAQTCILHRNAKLAKPSAQ
jgi:hypothetical protein